MSCTRSSARTHTHTRARAREGTHTHTLQTHAYTRASTHTHTRTHTHTHARAPQQSDSTCSMWLQMAASRVQVCKGSIDRTHHGEPNVPPATDRNRYRLGSLQRLRVPPLLIASFVLANSSHSLSIPPEMTDMRVTADERRYFPSSGWIYACL